MKKLVLIFLIFFTIFLQADPVDITARFQQAINKTLPGGFKVECSTTYKSMFEFSRTIAIKSPQGETASYVGYSKVPENAPNFYQSIAIIETKPKFERRGLGSALLQYVKSQCTGNCLGTGVHAFNPENETIAHYASLKKFYTRNGGECYEEEMTSEGPISGFFNFSPNQ